MSDRREFIGAKENASLLKGLVILDVLVRNYMTGFLPSELAKATGLAPHDITRYVSTLISAGYAEKIQQTGRIRPGRSFARHAVLMLHAVEQAEAEIRDIKNNFSIVK